MEVGQKVKFGAGWYHWAVRTLTLGLSGEEVARIATKTGVLVSKGTAFPEGEGWYVRVDGHSSQRTTQREFEVLVVPAPAVHLISLGGELDSEARGIDG